MKKGRELLGLPIIDAATRRRLGEVEDLLFDDKQFRITGFLIDKGGWFHPARLVPLTGIQQLASDMLKAENTEPQALTARVPLVSKLQRKKVTTQAGKPLGSVQDIVVDENSFRITGLEISDGLIRDLLSGRALIERAAVITESEHVVIVEDQLADIWERRS